jgi:hypothetical protein
MSDIGLLHYYHDIEVK